jgi:hypothetical protein
VFPSNFLVHYRMNGDEFSTPANKPQYGSFSSRSTATKRDSLTAELERGQSSIGIRFSWRFLNRSD